MTYPPPLRIAIVGCGAVSRKYVPTLRAARPLRIVGYADLDRPRAESAAAGTDAMVLSPAEAVTHDDVDLVVNLTSPAAHLVVSRAALSAGKHVYTEKPLATTLADGRAIVDLADRSALRVASAPDTMLGTGIQTARRLVDDGALGRPTSAAAFFMTGGPEQNHPSPGFLYATGGGPLYDMGPYYLSALVTLLGPIRRVCGFGRAALPQRHVTSGPNAGMIIEVGVDTHVAAVLEHHDGQISTLVASFDVPGGTTTPRIEVHGTNGSMSVPNPNLFDGPVAVRATGTDWSPTAQLAGYRSADRGVGVADLAVSLSTGQPHRATADLALHVLDAIESIGRSCRTGRAVALSTTCRRPVPVPLTAEIGSPIVQQPTATAQLNDPDPGLSDANAAAYVDP